MGNPLPPGDLSNRRGLCLKQQCTATDHRTVSEAKHQSLVSYLDQGTAVHCRGRPSRRDKQSLNGVDPSAARLAPARSCPHSGQIVTPAEDTEPFPISIHSQDEGLKLASRLLGWGGTAGYKGFPSDRWSGITCVCLISRVEHTLETGPLKTIRKDTCGTLPPWFSRFSVRRTLPSTHTAKRASRITPPSKPNLKKSELVRQIHPLLPFPSPYATANLH